MTKADSMRHGIQLAQRAERSPHLPIMPRDENDARGIAAYYGLTAQIVFENTGPLGITVARLRQLSDQHKAAKVA